MKKLLSIIITIILSLGCVCSLTACGEKEKLEVKTIHLTDETYAFAINKDNTSLKEQINTILLEMEDSGEMDTIIQSFFNGKATFKYKNPAEPNSSNRANYFVVGTNAYFPPFEMYEGDKLSGIDMKIASVLATKLGKTLYIKDMAFDALIPSVMNKEVDIAMAGMTVNETRLKSVDFTNGYYTSAQVITVLEKDTTFDECETVEDVEAILASKDSSFKVGTQKGTTGYMYTAGDVDFEYPGFANITVKPYKTGALAMTDLQNGKINAVILDEQPSKMIVKSLNS